MRVAGRRFGKGLFPAQEDEAMLLTLILFYFGPILLLLVLGLLSIRLTLSGYFSGRSNIGWIYLGVCVLIFLVCAGGRSRMGASAGAMFGSLFHVIFLGLLLGLQTPLIIELISQLIVPDPGKGLKLIKTYSEAETKVAADDLTGAIAEYEKVIAKDRGDITARLRLAELRYLNKEYHMAAADYEALLSHANKLDVSQHCSALTRLSDIYAQHLGDTEQARKHISTIVEKHPNTKYADYANERLTNL